jgi:hypothetical protein
MNWLVLFIFIGGALATPIQQGVHKIVHYKADKDGIIQKISGEEAALPQPIVWNQDQPIVVEPAPLIYSSGGSVITERDQQRHINVEDEIESREDDSISTFETQPETGPKDDSGNIQLYSNDQRPIQTGTTLLGSGILPVKGVVEQQVGLIQREHQFPEVVTGQRRLVETVPQQQNSNKARSLQENSAINIVHQTLQHGTPVSVQEYRVSPQGVRLPVIQYQWNPEQQSIPQTWLRRQSNQFVNVPVKGGPVQYQYFIKPVIPSNINPFNRQQIQTYVIQQEQNQQGQTVGSLNVQEQPQEVTVNQRNENIRPVNVVQRVTETVKPNIQTTGVKSFVQYSDQKIDDNSRPVVSGQTIVGYQSVDAQPQISQQIPVQLQTFDSRYQSYVPIIVEPAQSPINQYQQVQVQSIPYYTYGQRNRVPITYSITGGIPLAQGIQYSNVEQPIRTVDIIQPQQQQQNVYKPRVISYQAVKGVQQNQQVQNRGQDLSVNPSSAGQLSSVRQIGVKGVVSV